MKNMQIRICAVIFGIVALGAIASADTSGPLDLGGDNPATVYVKLDTSKKPVFSKTKDGTYYTGGIKWSYDPKTLKKLSITFVLSSGVKEIKSKTKKFKIGTVTNGEQTGTVKAKQADDHFTVVKSDGTPEDPKIIVNPQ